MTEYRISKEKCKESINGICSRCGGEITPLETVDNSNAPTYWAGCEKCCCFDNGVSKEVYKTAVELVDVHRYEYYNHFDDSTDKDYARKEQISAACGIVAKVLNIYNQQLS